MTVRGADAPGMTRWEAFLPAEVSTRMWNAVDALASTYCRNTAGLAVDAARADALADLVLANSTVRTTAELLVPVLPSAADGSAPTTWMVAGPVEDTHVGTLLPKTVAALLADPDVLVRLSRLDPDGGVVQDARSYRPSAALRRRVRSRDRTCRFPGCNTPAARCDLDHVVPYPHGPTDETNLMCVCRTHHLFKHHGGWRSRLSLDGTVTWRAPDGRTYLTRPGTRHLVDDLLKVTGDGACGDPQVRRSGPSLAQLVVEEPGGPHGQSSTWTFRNLRRTGRCCLSPTGRRGPSRTGQRGPSPTRGIGRAGRHRGGRA